MVLREPIAVAEEQPVFIDTNRRFVLPRHQRERQHATDALEFGVDPFDHRTAALLRLRGAIVRDEQEAEAAAAV